MSENYRSREERRQVKKKKQPAKHKSQKVNIILSQVLITCLLLGIVGLVAGLLLFRND